jgi:hypothetical protein
MSGAIPVGDARRISRERQQPLVIIFGLNADGSEFNVTTYGATKKLCKVAASLGEQFAQAVLNGRVGPPETEPEGAPEVPARFAGVKD